MAKRFESKSKKVNKIVRGRLVERDAVTGEERKVSQRGQDFQLKKKGEQEPLSARTVLQKGKRRKQVVRRPDVSNGPADREIGAAGHGDTFHHDLRYDAPIQRESEGWKQARSEVDRDMPPKKRHKTIRQPENSRIEGSPDAEEIAEQRPQQHTEGRPIEQTESPSLGRNGGNASRIHENVGRLRMDEDRPVRAREKSPGSMEQDIASSFSRMGKHQKQKRLTGRHLLHRTWFLRNQTSFPSMMWKTLLRQRNPSCSLRRRNSLLKPFLRAKSWNERRPRLPRRKKGW